MKSFLPRSGILILLLVAVLTPACGDDDDSPTEPTPPPQPGNLPPVPIPTSVNDLLPLDTDPMVVGMSDPIAHFAPLVAQVRRTLDNGTQQWFAMNRHATLACPGVLPRNTGDPSSAQPTYISGPPRLLHERYWHKFKQVILDPGSGYDKEETISYGTSTTHEQSREFSRSIGVELTAGGGWGGFSAEVSASYEQTETASELNSVSFSEQSTFTERYYVQPDPSHTMVYVIWQLVDRFSLVDADTVRIHQSPTLWHVQLPAIADIDFPNRGVIHQSVTRF